MSAPPTWRQVLFVSTLSPEHQDDVFSAICGESGARNALLSVVGALIFDGRRFAQLLQGPADALAALLRRIADDPRHASMRTLLDEEIDATQALDAWIAGVVEPGRVEQLDAAPDATRCLAKFLDMLGHADLAHFVARMAMPGLARGVVDTGESQP
jgi:hypothetical protein